MSVDPLPYNPNPGPGPDYEAIYEYGARFIKLGDRLWEYYLAMVLAGEATGGEDSTWAQVQSAMPPLAKLIVDPAQPAGEGGPLPSACRLLWNVGELINWYAKNLEEERRKEEAQRVKEVLITVFTFALAAVSVAAECVALVAMMSRVFSLVQNLLVRVVRLFTGAAWAQRLAGFTGGAIDGALWSVGTDIGFGAAGAKTAGIDLEINTKDLLITGGIGALTGGAFGIVARPAGRGPGGISTGAGPGGGVVPGGGVRPGSTGGSRLGAPGPGGSRPTSPGSGASRPATPDSGTSRPGITGSGSSRPTSPGSGVSRPGTPDSGASRPGTPSSGSSRPTSTEYEGPLPATPSPGGSRLGTPSSEAGPGGSRPGTTGSGSGTDPGVVRPASPDARPSAPSVTASGRPGETVVPPGETVVPPGGKGARPGEAVVHPGEAVVPPGGKDVRPGEAVVHPGEAVVPPGGAVVPRGGAVVHSGAAVVPPGGKGVRTGETGAGPWDGAGERLGGGSGRPPEGVDAQRHAAVEAAQARRDLGTGTDGGPVAAQPAGHEAAAPRAARPEKPEATAWAGKGGQRLGGGHEAPADAAARRQAFADAAERRLARPAPEAAPKPAAAGGAPGPGSAGEAPGVGSAVEAPKTGSAGEGRPTGPPGDDREFGPAVGGSKTDGGVAGAPGHAPRPRTAEAAVERQAFRTDPVTGQRGLVTLVAPAKEVFPGGGETLGGKPGGRAPAVASGAPEAPRVSGYRYHEVDPVTGRASEIPDPGGRVTSVQRIDDEKSVLVHDRDTGRWEVTDPVASEAAGAPGPAKSFQFLRRDAEGNIDLVTYDRAPAPDGVRTGGTRHYDLEGNEGWRDGGLTDMGGGKPKVERISTAVKAYHPDGTKVERPAPSDLLIKDPRSGLWQRVPHATGEVAAPAVDRGITTLRPVRGNDGLEPVEIHAGDLRAVRLKGDEVTPTAFSDRADQPGQIRRTGDGSLVAVKPEPDLGQLVFDPRTGALGGRPRPTDDPVPVTGPGKGPSSGGSGGSHQGGSGSGHPAPGHGTAARPGGTGSHTATESPAVHLTEKPAGRSTGPEKAPAGKPAKPEDATPSGQKPAADKTPSREAKQQASADAAEGRQKSAGSSTKTETVTPTGKLTETKPTEAKPAETKPAETKPAGTKPAGTKPGAGKHAPSRFGTTTIPASAPPLPETVLPETVLPETVLPETAPPQITGVSYWKPIERTDGNFVVQGYGPDGVAFDGIVLQVPVPPQIPELNDQPVPTDAVLTPDGTWLVGDGPGASGVPELIARGPDGQQVADPVAVPGKRVLQRLFPPPKPGRPMPGQDQHRWVPIGRDGNKNLVMQPLDDDGVPIEGVTASVPAPDTGWAAEQVIPNAVLMPGGQWFVPTGPQGAPPVDVYALGGSQRQERLSMPPASWWVPIARLTGRLVMQGHHLDGRVIDGVTKVVPVPAGVPELSEQAIPEAVLTPGDVWWVQAGPGELTARDPDGRPTAAPPAAPSPGVRARLLPPENPAGRDEHPWIPIGRDRQGRFVMQAVDHFARPIDGVTANVPAPRAGWADEKAVPDVVLMPGGVWLVPAGPPGPRGVPPLDVYGPHGQVLDRRPAPTWDDDADALEEIAADVTAGRVSATDCVVLTRSFGERLYGRRPGPAALDDTAVAPPKDGPRLAGAREQLVAGAEWARITDPWAIASVTAALGAGASAFVIVRRPGDQDGHALVLHHTARGVRWVDLHGPAGARVSRPGKHPEVLDHAAELWVSFTDPRGVTVPRPGIAAESTSTAAALIDPASNNVVGAGLSRFLPRRSDRWDFRAEPNPPAQAGPVPERIRGYFVWTGTDLTGLPQALRGAVRLQPDRPGRGSGFRVEVTVAPGQAQRSPDGTIWVTASGFPHAIVTAVRGDGSAAGVLGRRFSDIAQGLAVPEDVTDKQGLLPTPMPGFRTDWKRWFLSHARRARSGVTRLGVGTPHFIERSAFRGHAAVTGPDGLPLRRTVGISFHTAHELRRTPWPLRVDPVYEVVTGDGPAAGPRLTRELPFELGPGTFAAISHASQYGMRVGYDGRTGPWDRSGGYTVIDGDEFGHRVLADENYQRQVAERGDDLVVVVAACRGVSNAPDIARALGRPVWATNGVVVVSNQGLALKQEGDEEPRWYLVDPDGGLRSRVPVTPGADADELDAEVSFAPADPRDQGFVARLQRRFEDAVTNAGADESSPETLFWARYPGGVRLDGQSWAPDSPGGWRPAGTWGDVSAAAADAGDNGFLLVRPVRPDDGAVGVHVGRDGASLWAFHLSPDGTVRAPQRLDLNDTLGLPDPGDVAAIDYCADVRRAEGSPA